MRPNDVSASAIPAIWIWVGLLFGPSVASAQSIGGGQSQLNILFLVEAVAVWVVVIGIFFWWNRLVGVVVGFILRLALWRSQHVWISFESLQFSPLSGRILFKNLRYHSSNMSIRILKGHATWRFWKWNVRTEGPLDNLKLPCRCSIYVEGLEWFLYNRTPAYDAIVERMKATAELRALSAPTKDIKDQSKSHQPRRRRWWGGRKRPPPPDQHDQEKPVENPNRARPLSPPVPPSARLRERLRKSRRPEEQKAEWNWARDLLPVEIIVDTGAVVIGSDATPTVTIAEFKNGNGTYEATESRSRLDLYKQLARFNFTQVKVLVRTNPDYTGVLLEHGKRAYEELVKDEHSLLHKPPAEFTVRAAFHDLSKRFAWMHDGSFTKPPSYASAYYGPDNEWKGLARYRNIDGKEMRPQTLQEIDYAKVATLLDTPALDLEYYVDVPGVVPPECKAGDGFLNDCVGNGDLPPEWGVDVVTHGGFLTYGPWADRQRDAIMRAFTPSIFFHSDPTPHLRTGDKRIHSELKVTVELMEETVLRMPTREASKDWEYPRHNGPPVQRKFGWLDLKIGTRSFIQYTLPIVATAEGYSTTLELGLHGLSVSSHVNYDTFLHADTCRVTARMPTPLQWDARRDWQFDITMSRPVITLLRDHITLISDLAKDWNSGPQGDFFHFTPYDYQFKVTLSHYQLKLYVNDFNVVDYPNRDDENAFLILHGDALSSDIEVPAIRFRPESTTIPFSVRGSDVHLDMTLPGWHTQNSFGTPETRRIGKVGILDVRGTYLYYNSVSSDHVETLSLVVQIENVSFRMLGWAIRRMILIKDNYFGTFTHFRTFGELVEDWDKVPKVFGDRVEEKYRPGKSDIFAVNLEFSCSNGIIIAPENIYAFDGGAIIPVPELQVHLRSNTDYMELMVSAPPLAIGYLDHAADVFANSCLPLGGLGETLLIDGLRITANRLFGPPPRNATYLCLWDFELGSVGGQCGLHLLHRLGGVQRAFATTYTDAENAPASVYNPPTDPDVTFLRLAVRRLGLTVMEGQTAVVVEMPRGLTVGINTLAGQAYYSAVSVTIPEIQLKMLLSLVKSSPAHCEVASASGAVEFDLFGTPRGWQGKAMKQQAFITTQDKATRRLQDLYAHVREFQGTPLRVALRRQPFYLPNPVMPNTPEEESSDGESSLDDDYDDRSQGDVKDEAYQSSASSLDFATEWPRQTTSGISPYDSASAESGSISDGAPSTVDSTVPLRDTLHETGTHTDTDVEPQGHVRIPVDLLKVLKLFRKVDASTSSTFEPINQSSSEDPDDVDSGSETFPEAASDIPAGECTTFIRVRSPRALRLLVTPSAVLAVCEVQNVWGDLSRVVSPETRLDILLSDRTDAVTSQSNNSSRMSLDMRLPEVTVKVLQQSSMPLSNGRVSQSLLSTDLLAKHLVVRTSSTSGESQDAGLIARGAIQMVSLGISANAPNPAGRSSLDRMQYLECSLIGSKAFYRTSKQADRSGGLHLGKANLTVEPVLATAASAIVSPWKTALSGNGSHATTPLHRDLQFVHALLTDSTSTYRLGDDPHYWGWKCDLLRPPTSKDEPNNLRDDAGWKVLSRLRHLIRKKTGFVTVHQPIPLSQDQLEQTRQEIMRALLSFREDYGEEDLEKLPFLQTSAHREDSASRVGKEAGSISFVLGYTQLVLKAQEFDASHPVGELTTQHLVSTVKLAQLEALSRGADGVVDINVNVGLIQLETYPSVLATVNGLLRAPSVDGREAASAAPASMKASSTPQGMRPGHIIMAVAIDRSIFALNAHTLRCEVEGQQVKLTGTVASKCSEQGSSVGGQREVHDYDIALAAKLDSGMIVLKGEGEELISLTIEETLAQVTAQESPQNRLDLVVKCQQVSFRSLKDPKGVYQTITVWRREHLTEYEATLKSLLQDGVSGTETNLGPTTSKSRPRPIYTLDIVIKRLSFTVGISRKAWVFWHLNDIYAHASQTGSADLTSGEQIDSGLKIGSQSSGFSQNITLAALGDDNAHAKAIRIPCMAAAVAVAISRDTIRVRGSLSVDPFIGTFKPTVLERILSTYKALGQDVRALALFGETLIRKGDTASPVEPSPIVTKRALIYNLKVESKGIRVRLRASGVSSMLTVQASSIGGWITNCGQELESTKATSAKSTFDSTTWDVRVEGLRLSTGIATVSQQSEADRDIKPRVTETAFMVLDIGLSQRVHKDRSSQNDLTPIMHVHGRIANAHAVMQVTALGQVYDMLDSWSADMRAVRERRAKEWTDIVQETSRLIKPEVKPTPAERQDWLEKHTISLEISGVAVAFPLFLERAAVLGQEGASSGPQATPALLFSIGDIYAINRRGQVGRADVKDLLIQFVREFDATNAAHFQGLHHSSGNRMHLPNTVFESRLRTDETSRSVWLRGVFSGFELRLDTNFVDYARLFLEVYRQGRDSIEQLVEDYPMESQLGVSKDPETPVQASRKSLSLRTSLDFYSGRVCLYQVMESDVEEMMSIGGQRARLQPLDHSKRTLSAADIIILPGISTWVEHHSGGPHTTALNAAQRCMISAVIHSSENTLRPSLIPFIDAIALRLRAGGIHRATTSVAKTGALDARLLGGKDAVGTACAPQESAMSSTELAFSLRIDPSTLDLSCQPDSPVLAGIAWGGGGFTLQKDSFSHKIALTAHVAGVSLRSRHAYLTNQESVSAGIKDLNATAVWDLKPVSEDRPQLQLLIDTSLAVDVKLQRFQDLLCLQAVWVDRMPVLEMASTEAQDERPVVKTPSLAPSRRVVTVRVRHVDISADLVVSRVKLVMEPVVFRADLHASQDISVNVQKLELSASGSISGSIKNSAIAFEAVRKARHVQALGDSTLLAISLDIAATLAQIDLEGQRITDLHLLPSKVTLQDDWTSFDDCSTDQPLELAFSVEMGAIDGVLSVLGLPGLLDSVDRVGKAYQDQKVHALAESKAYRQYREAKPVNAFASVAVAMQESVQQRQSAKTDGKKLKVVQALHLETHRIRFALYKTSDFSESFYRLDLATLSAEFKRDFAIGGSPLRNLTSKLEGVRLRRFTPRGMSRVLVESVDVGAWMDRASSGTELRVVSLPNTTVVMSSLEDTHRRSLSYDYAVAYAHGSQGRLELDFQLGVFIEIRNLYRSLLAAIKRTEESSIAEAKAADAESEQASSPDPDRLTYKPGKVELRPPQMNILGDFSEDLLGSYTEKWLNLAPEVTHSFVTAFLENGMDVLLGVYEHMLPT